MTEFADKFPPEAPGQLTIDGTELQPPSAMQASFWPPCCEQALVETGYFCVCAYVTVCPDHGRRHNGTHD